MEEPRKEEIQERRRGTPQAFCLICHKDLNGWKPALCADCINDDPEIILLHCANCKDTTEGDKEVLAEFIEKSGKSEEYVQKGVVVIVNNCPKCGIEEESYKARIWKIRN